MSVIQIQLLLRLGVLAERDDREAIASLRLSPDQVPPASQRPVLVDSAS